MRPVAPSPVPPAHRHPPAPGTGPHAKTLELLRKAEKLLQQLATIEQLYEKSAPSRVKTLIAMRQEDISALRAQFKEETARTGDDRDPAADSGLAELLKSISVLESSIRIADIECDMRIMEEKGETKSHFWISRRREDIHNNLGFLHERLQAAMLGEIGGRSHIDRVVGALASWRFSAETNLQKTLRLLAEEAAEYTKARETLLGAATAYQSLLLLDSHAADTKRDRMRTYFRNAGACGANCIASQFDAVLLRFWDALASQVSFSGMEARPAALAFAESGYAAGVLLGEQLQALLQALQQWLAPGSGAQENEIGQLVACDKEIESLADKFNGLLAFFPDGAREENAAAVGALVEELLKLQYFVRSELELRNYVPPQLPQPEPRQSGVQQKLLEQVAARTTPPSADESVAPAAGKARMPARREEGRRTPEPAGSDPSSPEEPGSGSPDGSSSEPAEEAPLDLAYFPHLLNRTGNKAARTASVGETLASIDAEREGALARIAARLRQPAYDLRHIGNIGREELKHLVDAENKLLDEHQVRTEISISELKNVLRRAGAAERAGIEERIERLQTEGNRLQVEISARQFPNRRAMRILIGAGLVELRPQQIGTRAVARDDDTGEFSAFDSHHVVLARPQGTQRIYAGLHAHYLCDASGHPILNAQGDKQYIERPLFNAMGEFERMGKAIHLKHPSQERLGRDFEASTGTVVHRWPLGLRDLQMMLAAAPR